MFNMTGVWSEICKCTTVMIAAAFLVGCNIGAFVTPYGFSLISAVKGSSSAALSFNIFGAVFALLFVLSFVCTKSFLTYLEAGR